MKRTTQKKNKQNGRTGEAAVEGLKTRKGSRKTKKKQTGWPSCD